MTISPLYNNALMPDSLQGRHYSFNDSSSASSRSEALAKDNSTPSVIVSISSQSNVQTSALSGAQNSQAAEKATIPALYSRISVGASTRAEQSVQAISQGQENSKNLSGADTTKSAATANTTADKHVDSEDKASDKALNNDKARGSRGSSELDLSAEEQEQLTELKLRDREVRAHEQAHKSAGGQYAGAISLSYQSGPDGKRYAVGGEVPIDVSPVSGDPAATIAKMNVVRAAAAAPASPSAQDRSVAAAASSAISKAQGELVALASESGSQPDIKSRDDIDQQKNNDPKNVVAVNAYEVISNSRPAQQNSVIDALV